MEEKKPVIGWLIPLVVLAIIFGFLIFKSCNKTVPETIKIAIEPNRKRILVHREKQNEQIKTDTLKYLAQRKEDSLLVRYWRNKYFKETAKGTEIEIQYRDKPTLALCDTLLKNKDKRIDALYGNIKAYQQDSLNKETIIKKYSGFVLDKDAKIDSLNALAGECESKLQKQQKKVTNRNKLLKAAGLVVAVLAGVIAIK
jgi:hypothetical protein